MLVRGCHAPVFVRQGTAEARHRAPTYRERWVKNDGSGTLGYFGDQRSPGNRAAFLLFRDLRKRICCEHSAAEECEAKTPYKANKKLSLRESR